MRTTILPLVRLCVSVDILLTCGVHLHARIISLRGAVWVHTSSLTQELYTQVPVPSKESKRSCICVQGLSILLPSTIVFGAVRTLYYFFNIYFTSYFGPYSMIRCIGFLTWQYTLNSILVDVFSPLARFMFVIIVFRL